MPSTTSGPSSSTGRSMPSKNGRPSPSTTGTRLIWSSSSRPASRHWRTRLGVATPMSLPRGRLARLGDRALEAVGDEVDRAVARPVGGRLVGEDEDGHAHRVAAAPALREVEVAAAADERADGLEGLAEQLGAGSPRCGTGPTSVSPLEEPLGEAADVVVRRRDVAVERHRHVGDQLGHGGSLRWGWVARGDDAAARPGRTSATWPRSRPQVADLTQPSDSGCAAGPRPALDLAPHGGPRRHDVPRRRRPGRGGAARGARRSRRCARGPAVARRPGRGDRRVPLGRRRAGGGGGRPPALAPGARRAAPARGPHRRRPSRATRAHVGPASPAAGGCARSLTRARRSSPRAPRPAAERTPAGTALRRPRRAPAARPLAAASACSPCATRTTRRRAAAALARRDPEQPAEPADDVRRPRGRARRAPRPPGRRRAW